MVAASKPTSWLSTHLYFLVTLNLYFGTLADGLDCFPFEHEAYPSYSDSCVSNSGIRSLVGLGGLVGP